jgi:hypothetical protein
MSRGCHWRGYVFGQKAALVVAGAGVGAMSRMSRFLSVFVTWGRDKQRRVGSEHFRTNPNTFSGHLGTVPDTSGHFRTLPDTSGQVPGRKGWKRCVSLHVLQLSKFCYESCGVGRSGGVEEGVEGVEEGLGVRVWHSQTVRVRQPRRRSLRVVCRSRLAILVQAFSRICGLSRGVSHRPRGFRARGSTSRRL